MRVPLAWRNLTHHRARTAVALGGIGFSLVLIFMQLGFLGSVARTATVVYDRLDADIVLLSPNYQFLNDPGDFPRTRLRQALATTGIASAAPLHIMTMGWLDPGEADPERIRRRATMVLGVNPQAIPFRDPAIKQAAESLKQPDRFLFDTRSRPEFHPRTVGSTIALDQLNLTLDGQFAMGTGFAAEGVAVVGEPALEGAAGKYDPERVSLGLLRIAVGQDAAAVAAVLNARLAPDVRALTLDALKNRERWFWIAEKSIGVIFAMGVAVAFLVGLVVVYQVLLSDIVNQFAEYATLKAMGYSNRQLGAIVLRQATLLSLMGYVPALGISWALYDFTRSFAGIPIEMNWPVAVFVCALSTGMCAVAALLSIRKVQSADPAALF